MWPFKKRWTRRLLSAEGEDTAGAKRGSGRPVTARRSAGYLAAGGLLSTVLGAFSGLIIGRLVDPSTLGLFNGISLVLPYVSLLGFGVSTGLSRELPYFMGKGDRRRAKDLSAVTQTWSLLVGGAVFMALLGVAGWRLAQGNSLEAAGWFSNAIVALLLFYTDYLQVTYRTARDFARLAVVRVAQQVALVALLALVVPLDFYGLCLRVVFATAFTVVLLFRTRPVRVGPGWETSNLKHLLRIGLPIFIVFQIFTYWAVLDQTLVLRLGGTRMMGLYAMVILVTGAVQTIPGAVSQVLYPRMFEQYGKGQSLREVARGIVKPVAVTTVAVVPVILVAWWIVGPLTRLLVPEYVDAVPAMQWALPLCFVRCLETPYALFTTGRRQGLRLVGVIIGMAIYGGSLFLLIRDGVYIAAFPQAMLVGRVVCLVVSFALIYRMLAGEKDSSGLTA